MLFFFFAISLISKKPCCCFAQWFPIFRQWWWRGFNNANKFQWERIHLILKKITAAKRVKSKRKTRWGACSFFTYQHIRARETFDDLISVFFATISSESNLDNRLSLCRWINHDRVNGETSKTTFYDPSRMNHSLCRSMARCIRYRSWQKVFLCACFNFAIGVKTRNILLGIGSGGLNREIRLNDFIQKKMTKFELQIEMFYQRTLWNWMSYDQSLMKMFHVCPNFFLILAKFFSNFPSFHQILFSKTSKTLLIQQNFNRANNFNATSLSTIFTITLKVFKHFKRLFNFVLGVHLAKSLLKSRRQKHSRRQIHSNNLFSTFFRSFFVLTLSEWLFTKIKRESNYVGRGGGGEWTKIHAIAISNNEFQFHEKKKRKETSRRAATPCIKWK